MATIITKTNKNGGVRYSIQFYQFDDATRRRTRKTVSLGSQYAKKQVERIARQIERILDCRASARELDPSLTVWLDEIDGDLRRKLASAGLIKTVENLTLATIFDRFEASARFQKYAPNTVVYHRRKREQFFKYFNPDERPDDLTVADVDDWRKSLTGEYAEATIAGLVKTVRTVFNWAVKQELLKSHRFNAIPRGTFENKSREFFVTREWFRKLLDAAPNQTWRAIIALCRIGGLRCPSEVFAARWGDVRWDDEKFLVRDSKRKTTRILPLFPELRRELSELFNPKTDGEDDFIVRECRSYDAAYRRFEKIVDQAGLPRWERLLHNLRGSRSNELFSGYAAHVAGAWMGQSASVALKHYLHPTDADYLRAVDEPENDEDKPKSKKRRPKSDC